MPNVDFYPQDQQFRYSILKSPVLGTIVSSADSGREYAVLLKAVPQWRFQLQYEIIATPRNVMSSVMGFFNCKLAQFDNFLFDDTSDDTVVGQRFAVGNGVTTLFQLTRNYNGIPYPATNIDNGGLNSGIAGPHLINKAAPVIYDNGSPVASVNYNFDFFRGQITFNTAPLNGHLLTADFTFYYRCRFEQPSLEFRNFAYQLWSLSKVSFITQVGQEGEFF